MDFELDDTQRQIRGSIERSLRDLAGPERARVVLSSASGFDEKLAGHLVSSGFADAFGDDSSGPLAVGLVVEAVARAVGCVPTTGPLLVAPAVLDRTDLQSLVLLDRALPGLVRFPCAGPAIVLDGDVATLVEATDEQFARLPVPYGFPMARWSPPRSGTRLALSADRVRAWWRVGIALEISGAMQMAMERAVDYVKVRHQFGQPIGAFQSIQHRLAASATQVEATRWLALEAAWLGAPDVAAATAAGFAAVAAERVMRDAHQVHGALGFTVEADLHLWTMRLQALRMELGGADAHHRAAGAAWLAARRQA